MARGCEFKPKRTKQTQVLENCGAIRFLAHARFNRSTRYLFCCLLCCCVFCSAVVNSCVRAGTVSSFHQMLGSIDKYVRFGLEFGNAWVLHCFNVFTSLELSKLQPLRDFNGLAFGSPKTLHLLCRS